MGPDPGSTTWRLRKALPTVGKRASTRLPEEFRELAAREEALGVRPDEFFLLRPDGTPDVDVCSFFHDKTFRRLSLSTRESYAKDLRTHLSFLSSQGMDWRDVTTDRFVDYEYWRRRDRRNLDRVSGAKFSRELAACRKFYEWQAARHNIAVSPVEVLEDVDPANREGETVPLKPKNLRNNRVKWLTPHAFRQWKDIGLAGYDLSGRRNLQWRGRNEDRNAAFADLLWDSGLRLREGGTLLWCEVPESRPNESFVRSRLAEAVAKGRGRDYWVSRAALQSLQSYRMSTRADVVARAAAAGRYDLISRKQVLRSVDRARRATIVDEAGQIAHRPLDELTAEEREHLYIEGPHGFEPAMVWLTEAGLPMKYPSWEMVFGIASKRCLSKGVSISCTPHMLRHSFALRMLVTLIHASDSRLGITPEERREYRLLFGDPWVLVQTLLGHSNVEITRQVYLEPVQGLQVELFLNGPAGEESPFLNRLAQEIASSPLINKGTNSLASPHRSTSWT